MNKIVNAILDLFPLIAPIPTAYAVATALDRLLGWPLVVLGIAALVIEGLGFVSADTAARYYEYNRDTKRGEKHAPGWIAYGAFALYFVITLGMTLMYEPLAAMFPGLSAVGFVLFVLRKDQQDRETNRVAERVEKERERVEKRKQKKDQASVPEVAASPPGRIGSDDNLIAYLRENPGQSQSKIAEYFGVTRSAVGQRIRSLKERNITWV